VQRQRRSGEICALARAATLHGVLSRRLLLMGGFDRYKDVNEWKRDFFSSSLKNKEKRPLHLAASAHPAKPPPHRHSPARLERRSIATDFFAGVGRFFGRFFRADSASRVQQLAGVPRARAVRRPIPPDGAWRDDSADAWDGGDAGGGARREYAGGRERGGLGLAVVDALFAGPPAPAGASIATIMGPQAYAAGPDLEVPERLYRENVAGPWNQAAPAVWREERQGRGARGQAPLWPPPLLTLAPPQPDSGWLGSPGDQV
jgi:hypothetical protein